MPRWGFLLYIRADDGTRSHLRLETEEKALHPWPGSEGKGSPPHDMTRQDRDWDKTLEMEQTEPPGPSRASRMQEATLGTGCGHKRHSITHLLSERINNKKMWP